MSDNKSKAIDFFLNNTGLKPQDILLVEKIEKGFTNEIYHLITKDKNEYKIRFSFTNPYINRDLERIIENTFFKDTIIFYDYDGNFIKKWFVGENLNKSELSEAFFQEIFIFIKKLQNIKPEINLKKPTYLLEQHIVPDDLKEPLALYIKIINDYVINDNDVICHNDLSKANIIICNNKPIVMDFEWSTYNHPYWDMSNLIKDLELSIEEVNKFDFFNQNYDKELLIKIIYATHFYTYYWTYKVPETKKIIEYRNIIIQRIKYWYNIIISNYG